MQRIALIAGLSITALTGCAEMDATLTEADESAASFVRLTSKWTLRQEICGDGVDNDFDGYIDEDCDSSGDNYGGLPDGISSSTTGGGVDNGYPIPDYFRGDWFDPTHLRQNGTDYWLANFGGEVFAMDRQVAGEFFYLLDRGASAEKLYAYASEARVAQFTFENRVRTVHVTDYDGDQREEVGFVYHEGNGLNSMITEDSIWGGDFAEWRTEDEAFYSGSVGGGRDTFFFFWPTYSYNTYYYTMY